MILRRKSAAERFFERAHLHTRHVSVEIDGLTYVVAADDDGVARNIFTRSTRPEFVVLPRALQVAGPVGGGCFVDVGANIGTTTIPAVAHHGFGTAVACEPSPGSAALLRANCALNGVADRVRVVEAVVSDTRGTVEFDVSGTAPGRHKVAAAGAEETIAVPTVSLDALVEDGVLDPATVGLLWIDAQGHEPQVLAGASSLLERRVPAVVAARRRKLARAGSTDSLGALLERHYDLFVDLRSPDLVADGWQPAPRPVSELPDWVREGPTTTDLLLYASSARNSSGGGSSASTVHGSWAASSSTE
jgi:FkbM family methyltransferase